MGSPPKIGIVRMVPFLKVVVLNIIGSIAGCPPKFQNFGGFFLFKSPF